MLIQRKAEWNKKTPTLPLFVCLPLPLFANRGVSCAIAYTRRNWLFNLVINSRLNVFQKTAPPSPGGDSPFLTFQAQDSGLVLSCSQDCLLSDPCSFFCTLYHFIWTWHWNFFLFWFPSPCWVALFKPLVAWSWSCQPHDHKAKPSYGAWPSSGLL